MKLKGLLSVAEVQKATTFTNEIIECVISGMIIMRVGDARVEPQQENDFLHDQKHQEHMRAALDMVCQVDNVQRVKTLD